MHEPSFAQHGMLVKLAVTAVIASAGAPVLAAMSASPPRRYYMVDELVTSGDVPRSELKVHGWVLAGTIKDRVIDGEITRTLVLQKSGKKLRVFSKGPMPDMVRDQSELVVVGTLVPAGDMADRAADLGVAIDDDMPYVLDATDLLAKCVTKYDGRVSDNRLKYE